MDDSREGADIPNNKIYIDYEKRGAEDIPNNEIYIDHDSKKGVSIPNKKNTESMIVRRA